MVRQKLNQISVVEKTVVLSDEPFAIRAYAKGNGAPREVARAISALALVRALENRGAAYGRRAARRSFPEHHAIGNQPERFRMSEAVMETPTDLTESSHKHITHFNSAKVQIVLSLAVHISSFPSSRRSRSSSTFLARRSLHVLIASLVVSHSASACACGRSGASARRLHHAITPSHNRESFASSRLTVCTNPSVASPVTRHPDNGIIQLLAMAMAPLCS